MHSLALISTVFAIVALVTSGPIDPSVNTYETPDGSDGTFVEAFNPNTISSDNQDDPTSLAANPGVPANPANPKKGTTVNQGQQVPGAAPGQPVPGAPPGQPPSQGGTQDDEFNPPPEGDDPEGCHNYVCPFGCNSICPCYAYCQDQSCNAKLIIATEPTVNWHYTCGPASDPQSLESKCPAYCRNLCPQIKTTGRKYDRPYCDKFFASNELGSPLAYSQMDDGGASNNDGVASPGNQVAVVGDTQTDPGANPDDAPVSTDD